jgi:hypothetical protein
MYLGSCEDPEPTVFSHATLREHGKEMQGTRLRHANQLNRQTGTILIYPSLNSTILYHMYTCKYVHACVHTLRGCQLCAMRPSLHLKKNCMGSITRKTCYQDGLSICSQMSQQTKKVREAMVSDLFTPSLQMCTQVFI